LGIDEFKEELVELVDYLKNPDKYVKAGAKLPKGLLLVGPPGTGKTMLARALAGESNCSFFYKSGAEFDEVFVGVGASRIRKLFKKARENVKVIYRLLPLFLLTKLIPWAAGATRWIPVIPEKL